MRDGNGFTVQFTDVRPFRGTGTYTFQVSLRASGEIVFRYLSMTGAVTGATIGLQGGSQNVGLPIAFNTEYLHDRL